MTEDERTQPSTVILQAPELNVEELEEVAAGSSGWIVWSLEPEPHPDSGSVWRPLRGYRPHKPE